MAIGKTLPTEFLVRSLPTVYAPVTAVVDVFSNQVHASWCTGDEFRFSSATRCGGVNKTVPHQTDVPKSSFKVLEQFLVTLSSSRCTVFTIHSFQIEFLVNVHSSHTKEKVCVVCVTCVGRAKTPALSQAVFIKSL
jgi:hypothetical protein